MPEVQIGVVGYTQEEINLKNLSKLKRKLYAIKQRCENLDSQGYKHYGAKGIKSYLSLNDLVIIWVRDKASSMQSASIDRINKKGNYVMDNCRFVERNYNSGLGARHSQRINYIVNLSNLKDESIIKIDNLSIETQKPLRWVIKDLIEKSLELE